MAPKLNLVQILRERGEVKSIKEAERRKNKAIEEEVRKGEYLKAWDSLNPFGRTYMWPIQRGMSFGPNQESVPYWQSSGLTYTGNDSKTHLLYNLAYTGKDPKTLLGLFDVHAHQIFNNEKAMFGLLGDWEREHRSIPDARADSNRDLVGSFNQFISELEQGLIPDARAADYSIRAFDAALKQLHEQKNPNALSRYSFTLHDSPIGEQLLKDLKVSDSDLELMIKTGYGGRSMALLFAKSGGYKGNDPDALRQLAAGYTGDYTWSLTKITKRVPIEWNSNPWSFTRITPSREDNGRDALHYAIRFLNALKTVDKKAVEETIGMFPSDRFRDAGNHTVEDIVTAAMMRNLDDFSTASGIAHLYFDVKDNIFGADRDGRRGRFIANIFMDAYMARPESPDFLYAGASLLTFKNYEEAATPGALPAIYLQKIMGTAETANLDFVKQTLDRIASHTFESRVHGDYHNIKEAVVKVAIMQNLDNPEEAWSIGEWYLNSFGHHSLGKGKALAEIFREACLERPKNHVLMYGAAVFLLESSNYAPALDLLPQGHRIAGLDRAELLRSIMCVNTLIDMDPTLSHLPQRLKTGFENLYQTLQEFIKHPAATGMEARMLEYKS